VGTDLLSSIGICVGAAALVALVGWRLRQPLILAYLVSGVLIGPHVNRGIVCIYGGVAHADTRRRIRA
jgi:Kef-type K+ transport system membrane component KefB